MPPSLAESEISLLPMPPREVVLPPTGNSIEGHCCYSSVTGYRSCVVMIRNDSDKDHLMVGNNSVSDGNTHFRHLPIAFFVQIIRSGQSLVSLIDSGASRSFIGPKEFARLEQLGIEVTWVPSRRVIVANGEEQIINRMMRIPIELEGRTLTAELYLMLALTQPCILGLDFLKTAGMVVDFAVNTWYYRDLQPIKYRFLPEIGLSCAF